ncbi:hypothetical protein PsorP6_008640 [Peronosclerospora sorghi]|uniref:Uncharacterized protein n=1 Tax=Peronosclerospora sorghi TaxID=230839 RepID=A0ACC0WAI6_9STRA|nr:hypothetical protein PsorP6_008640 [Peronosclerospora sorghi]
MVAEVQLRLCAHLHRLDFNSRTWVGVDQPKDGVQSSISCCKRYDTEAIQGKLLEIASAAVVERLPVPFGIGAVLNATFNREWTLMTEHLGDVKVISGLSNAETVYVAVAHVAGNILSLLDDDLGTGRSSNSLVMHADRILSM